MSSLSPETAVADGAGGGRQHATLALTSVTLPQVGAFLQAWRAAEPAWIVSSVDLTPLNTPAPIPGSDLPLRCVIGLEAVYSEEPVNKAGAARSGGAR
jgi:hypothetical protein